MPSHGNQEHQQRQRRQRLQHVGNREDHAPDAATIERQHAERDREQDRRAQRDTDHRKMLARSLPEALGAAVFVGTRVDAELRAQEIRGDLRFRLAIEFCAAFMRVIARASMRPARRSRIARTLADTSSRQTNNAS